jgi:Pectate lyase superfamily protein
LAIVQISQITNRKGLAENLPQLAGAELGWSIDTRQLWIGNGTLEEGAPVIGNTEILTEFSDILVIPTTYTYKGQAAGYTVQTGPTAGDPVTSSLQSWLDQFATVKDFGAVGDGTTDDTDAINRALYQLFCREVNPQIRRSLFFPAGVYRVTSSILIPPYATLYGEGLDNSVIQLDGSVDDSTLNAYVARSADSLQQIGVNIGNNGAAPPQYVTISNMGFVNLDPTTDVFLVEDAVNFRFQNVSFVGPLTQANLTTEGAFTRGVAFASTSSLVCDQIVFDGCLFSGTTYGVDTDQQTKGATFTNGKFDTLYRAIQLGTGAVVNGGATGTRIIGNLFDNIYAEGILFGDVSLNASGHNIFYDVGNHFGGTTTPYTAVIDIQSNNNVSISDMFQRADDYSNSATPGTAYPRITLNNTQSIATTNGVQTEQGTYTRQSGQIFTLYDDDSGTIFSIDADYVSAFSLDYTIIRGTGFRTGTVLVATDGSGTLSSSDDYNENLDIGVTISITQAGSTVSVDYTTTFTGDNASYRVSLTRLV